MADQESNESKGFKDVGTIFYKLPFLGHFTKGIQKAINRWGQPMLAELWSSNKLSHVKSSELRFLILADISEILKSSLSEDARAQNR